MLTKEDYERALLKIERLHPSPQILAKASQMMSDPDLEVEDLASLIKTDPSLATDVIRLSNSAYYGFETECNTVGAAIGRVGFREVLRLIGMCVSRSVFARELDHYQLKALDFWSESISMALLMEGFGRALNQNPQECYLIGLLHNIGRMVINELLTEFGEPAIYDYEQPIESWEKDAIGFNFAFAGSVLLKRWNFPNSICHPILHQLNPRKTNRPSAQLFSLFYSRKILAETDIGFINEYWELPQGNGFLQAFHIDEEDVRGMVNWAREQFISIKSSVGVEAAIS